MTEPQTGLLRWLWARGPTKRLRSNTDWSIVQHLRKGSWAECVAGEWRITEAGKEALAEAA